MAEPTAAAAGGRAPRRAASGRRGAAAVPTMWILAAVSPASAADFPVLTEMLASLCGSERFVLSPEYPCQLRIFGFSVAWSECSSAYLTDMQGFRKCVGSCLLDEQERCLQICGPHTNLTNFCYGECSRLSQCVEVAIGHGTGPTSAAGYYRDCFRGELELIQRGPPVAPARPSEVPRPSRPSSSPTATALDVRRSALQRGVLQPPPPDFGARDSCGCELIGVVRGVATGQGGCGRHGREPAAGRGQYCYVTGGARCAGAVPSSLFPGLHWAGCRRPTYGEVFPEHCEVTGHQGHLREQWEGGFYAKAVEMWTSLEHSFEHVQPANATAEEYAPAGEDALGSLQQTQADLRVAWAQPLPAGWQEAQLLGRTGLRGRPRLPPAFAPAGSLEPGASPSEESPC